MNRYVVIIIILVFGRFNLTAQENKVYLNNNLEALWKSSSVFKTPESVFYCKKQKALFVSNINGQPTEKDNNGFISKLSLDGNIIKLEWIKGLNAPKGMGIYKERLFVTDIDRIAEIDIQSEKIVRFYNVSGAKFLNDIAIDVSGRIFISDMQTNSIYLLYDGVVTKWLSGNMQEPNGLCLAKEYLFIGTKDKIVKVNLNSKLSSDYILNTGGIDGLTCFNQNQFLYSDWSGNIYLTGLGKETQKLLNTTPQKINAADFGFDYEKKVIYVPTFYDNRIMAYKLKL